MAKIIQFPVSFNSEWETIRNTMKEILTTECDENLIDEILDEFKESFDKFKQYQINISAPDAESADEMKKQIHEYTNQWLLHTFELHARIVDLRRLLAGRPSR